MKIEMDSDGNIIEEEVKITKTDPYKYLTQLAIDKIQLLKKRKRVIVDHQRKLDEISEIDAQITIRYKAVVPNITQEQRDYIIKNNLGLHHQLAEAFPSDFKEIISTTVTTEDPVEEK